eukprot:scaffold3719_cov247-Pinguiococcus_pyrenoidosus.AAC.8
MNVDAELFMDDDDDEPAGAEVLEEVAKLRTEVDLLTGRLKRRNMMLEVIQRAYQKDVLSVRQALLAGQGQPVPPEILTAVPSLDVRDALAVFAPFETYLRLRDDQRGGHFELVHKESRKIEALQDRVEHLLDELTAARLDAQRAQAAAKEDREALDVQVHKAQEDRDILTQKVLELKAKLSSSNMHVLKRTRHELAASRDEVRTALARLRDAEKLRPLLAASEKTVSELQRQLQARSELETQLDKAEATSKSRQQDVARLTREATVLRRKLATLDEVLGGLRAEVALATEKSGRMQTLLNAARHREADLMTQLQELQLEHEGNLEAEEKARNRLEKHLEKLLHESRQERQQLEQKAQDAIAAKERVVADYEQRHQAVTATLREKLDQNAQELLEKDAKIQTVEDSLNALKHEADTHLAKVKTEAEEKICLVKETAEEEMDALRSTAANEVQKAKAEAEAKIQKVIEESETSLAQSNRANEKQLNEMKTDAAKKETMLTQQIEALQALVRDQKEELEALRRRDHEAEEDAASQSGENQRKTADDALERDASVSGELPSTLERSSSTSGAAHKLKLLESETEAAREQETTELRSSVTKLTAEAKELSSALALLEDRELRWECQKAKLENQIESVRQELMAAKNEMEDKSKAWLAEKEKLEDQLLKRAEAEEAKTASSQREQEESLEQMGDAMVQTNRSFLSGRKRNGK